MDMDVNEKYNQLEKNLADIQIMAKKIYDMEEGGVFDSSMKGVFIDKFMTEYVAISGVNFCDMFDTIMEKQDKDHDTYGDIDESVTKLKITGKLGRDTDDYNYTATGMYLKDIFCGNSFIVIRVVEQHKTIERFIDIEYHVRKINKEFKANTIEFKKYVQYGDIRDDGYVVTFQKPKYDQPLKVKDDRGMVGKYEKYEQALRAIRSVHNSIQHER